MRAGTLRHKATIEQNTPTRSAMGAEVASWASFATWWCRLDYVAGVESLRGFVVAASSSHLALGRYVAGVTTAMRVTLGSRTFEIVAVDNGRAHKGEMVLSLKERL